MGIYLVFFNTKKEDQLKLKKKIETDSNIELEESLQVPENLSKVSQLTEHDRLLPVGFFCLEAIKTLEPKAKIIELPTLDKLRDKPENLSIRTETFNKLKEFFLVKEIKLTDTSIKQVIKKDIEFSCNNMKIQIVNKYEDILGEEPDKFYISKEDIQLIKDVFNTFKVKEITIKNKKEIK